MSDKNETIAALRRELAECETTLGRDHVEYAKVAVKLAIYRRYDQHEGQAEAESLLLHAIEIYEREFGPENRLLGHACEILAAIRERQGNSIEAESLLRRAIQQRLDEEGEDESFSEDTLQSLGCLLHEQGRYVEATEFLERALNVVERDHGSDYQFLVNHLHLLARTYVALQRYDDALELYRRELDLDTRYNPNDGDLRADLLEHMASVHVLAEQFDRSEELLAEARPLRVQIDHEMQDLYGRDRSINTQYQEMENLLEQAELLAARKDFEGAIALVQQVLDHRTSRPGSVTDSHTGLLKKLSKWNSHLERYDAAEALLLRARAYLETQVIPLDELQRQLREKEASPEWRAGLKLKPQGSYHLEMLASVWHDLGILHHKQKRLEDALHGFQQATAIWKVTHEKQPGFVSTGLVSVATTFHQLGDLDRCCELFDEALAWERGIRPDSSHVAGLLVNYAVIHESHNRLDEAVELRKTAVKFWIQNEGADQARVVHCLNEAAQDLVKLQRHEQARPLTQQALGIVRESSQYADRTLAALLYNLAMIEVALQRFKVAVPLMQEAYPLLQKDPKGAGAQLHYLLRHLTDAYLVLERDEEVESTALQWLAFLDREEPPNHPSVPCALTSLAISYFRRGRPAAALPLIERAIPLVEQIDGDDSPNLVNYLNIHGDILGHLCKHAAAKRVFARVKEIEAKARRKK